jgi:pimeloyl-ACP methyl ester carboxylesterase
MTLRLLLAATAILLLQTSSGFGQSSQLTAQAGLPPGKLVDVGGYKIHLHCTGKGRPTVILEAGMGDSSAIWSLIQTPLSKTLRVCSYDGAGTAWSDLGPIPRSMKQEVTELHELLAKAKEPGPFVLVGHSYGGLLVRLFQTVHPGEVAGMVLVESTHESTVLSVQRGGEPQARWVRIREQSQGRSVPSAKPLENAAAVREDIQTMEAFKACLSKPGKPDPSLAPLPAAAQVCESCSRSNMRFPPQTEDYWPDELQAMFEERTRSPQPLGSSPLSVIIGGKQAVGTPGEIQNEKDEQKRGLAGLSSNSRIIEVAQSGHHVHVEMPTAVLREIRDVAEAALQHKRLAQLPSR